MPLKDNESIFKIYLYIYLYIYIYDFKNSFSKNCPVFPKNP